MIKKIIAPLVIMLLASTIVIGYALLYLFIIKYTNLPAILNVLILSIVVLLVGALIAVFVQRIKEIQNEDENDLSKY